MLLGSVDMASKPKTKRSFILSFPVTTPALEVVQKGAAQGLSFTTGYVYVTRSDAKLNNKLKGKAPKVPSKALEKLITQVIARAQKEILAGLKRYL